MGLWLWVLEACQHLLSCPFCSLCPALCPLPHAAFSEAFLGTKNSGLGAAVGIWAQGINAGLENMWALLQGLGQWDSSIGCN